MKRLIEFFQDDDGQLSMSRLLMFLSWFPSTYIALANAEGINSVSIFGTYIGGYVLGYVGGRIANSMNRPRTPTLGSGERVVGGYGR